MMLEINGLTYEAFIRWQSHLMVFKHFNQHEKANPFNDILFLCQAVSVQYCFLNVLQTCLIPKYACNSNPYWLAASCDYGS